LEDVAQYWDDHSLADHWDDTREVEVDVRARRRYRVSLDPDVFGAIRAQAGRRLAVWAMAGEQGSLRARRHLAGARRGRWAVYVRAVWCRTDWRKAVVNKQKRRNRR